MKRSIFFDAWQACLRAHYIYVIRAGDRVTEPTLRHVLLQTGLTDDDLDDLRREALDSGPVDPDAAIVPEPAAELPAEPAAVEDEELPEEEALYVEEIPLDESLESPVEDDAEAPLEDDQPPSLHSGQQLSLF